MTRFADSPYFLIKDFMQELVLPTNFVNAPIIPFNTNKDTVFTDVIWVGGVSNFEPANPFYDNLLSYPSFDEGVDDANIFTTAETIWNGWKDIADRPSYYLEDLTLPGVLMRGMETSIVADGGQYIDLWAKTVDGFIPVRLSPVYEEPREHVYFRFDTVEIEILNHDGTQVIYDSDAGSCSDGGYDNMAQCEEFGHTWTPGDEPYYDSRHVSIQTYDYTITTLFSDDTVLDPSTEIYFRKDSAFHDWLKHERKAEYFYDNKFDLDFVMRNYVNTDKLFIYFGKIYPTEQDEIGNDATRYQIVYHGLKDWIQDALPPNNRKELFIEYLDTYFDMVYSEGYQQLKDVWSLRDAMECNETFLSYVPTFYGIKRYDDIPSWFADIYREYARDCVWLMKRKGTYSSMYIIYDQFCRNSQNEFNVYERWHDDNNSIPIITEYHDYPYVGYYDYPKNSVNYTPNVTADLGWTVTSPVDGIEFNVALDPVTRKLSFYLGDVDTGDGLGGSMNFEYQVYNANLIAIGENPFNPLDGSPENDILDGFVGGEMDFSYNDASGIWATNGGQQQWGVNTHYDEYFHTLDKLDETVLFRVKVRWISNNTGADFRMAFGDEYVATNEDMTVVDYYFSTGSLSQLMKGNMIETVYGLFGYPDGYVSSNNERQSPFYRADLDVSTEPLTDNKIMPKQIAENLYSNWELTRPINRQAEYNFLYQPVTDLTGKVFTLYEVPNSSQSLTWSTDNTKFDSDNFIFLQRIPAQVWTINHELGTEDVYVSAWSSDLTKMVPDVITVVNEDVVRVTFPLDTVGLVLVSKAQYNAFNHGSLKVFHGRNRDEIIVQMRNDATGNVEYPANIYNFDTNSLKVEGLDPAEDYSSYFLQGLRQGDSIDGHGPLDNTIWTFPSSTVGGTCSDEDYTDQAACELNAGTWTPNGEYWWVVEHGFDANAFLVNCYNDNNEQIYPAEIDYDYVVDGLPAIKIVFHTEETGFAAIKHVGDVVSFYGIVPRDAAGNLQTLEWRLTTATDEEINTFVRPEQPEYVRYANSNKVVHSWDGDVNDKSNFVWGQADFWEEDELWYYYTVVVKNEALEQLNIKSYEVLDIQLVNPNITRLSKQTVSFSRISGIYKPFGVNLVVKVKIFKDPNGVGSVLLDHLDEALRDHTNDPTDWNLTT